MQPESSAHAGRASGPVGAASSAPLDPETARLGTALERLALDTELFGSALPERLEIDLDDRIALGDDVGVAALRASLPTARGPRSSSLDELAEAQRRIERRTRALHDEVRSETRRLAAVGDALDAAGVADRRDGGPDR